MCGVSRLLGCYYLYPQVIPLPSTKSITLPPYINVLIIATHGLWKYVTQKEVYRCIRSYRDPNICSKRLADLAVAGGCPLDISVIVVKIVLGEDLSESKNVTTSLDHLESSFEMIEEGDESEEEMEIDDMNTMTNIDDILEDSFTDNIAPVSDQSYLESAGLRVISPDQLDALVNKDMKLEDLHSIDEILSVEDDGELIRDGSYVDIDDYEPDDTDVHDTVLSGKVDDYNFVMSMEKNLTEQQEEDGNSDGVSSVESGDSDGIDNEPKNVSKSAAKSVPEIKAEYELQLKEDVKMNPTVKNINVAISNVVEEDDLMSPEEEDQMMKGGSVKRKKSFVQSSYDRLSRHAFDTGTSFHSL